MNLSSSIAAENSTVFNQTAPTSSVFSIGQSVATNQSGKDFIAYVWAETPGVSSFGEIHGE